MSETNKQKIKSLRKNIVRWYKKNQRPMPWRNTKDPYSIWVSEIMLQQTQVETVIPYYNRFLQRFPTVTDLANASLHSVMKAWEGLGYYSRARSFHLAAKQIMHQFNGMIPSTKIELISLPGIGLYTAGAILSIAFEKPAPILDGNVVRVLSRVFHVTDNVSLSSTGIIWKRNRFLITLRPPRGLLGGLWEFPGGKKEKGENLQDCLKREIREELDIDIEVKDLFTTVKHAYTHFRITLHVFHCIWQRGKPKTIVCDDFRWVNINDLDQFAFPAADRNVILKLKEKNWRNPHEN